MKISFFLGGLSGGGSERVVCNLANYLVSHEHEVDIITMGDDNSFGLNEKIHRITLLYNQERRNIVFNSVIRLFRLVGYLHKHKKNTFVVMLPTTTILLLRLRALVKGKIIASERSYPTNYSIKDQRQLRHVAKRADAWVFQTETTKSWYQPYLADTQTVIIPNPINESFLRPVYRGERRKEIVTAGRLTKVKNHALLIEAFSRIANRHADATLKIFGDGALLKTLKEQAEALGVGNRVLLPGFMSWGEMSNDSAMFVLSSNLEGMPNALMEAMAMGLPCISTDCDGGGARFLIEDGVNGLLVPKNDVDAMADAMDKLLSDSELADKLGNEAHKICNQLAPEKIYAEWESYIISVVGNNKQTI